MQYCQQALSYLLSICLILSLDGCSKKSEPASTQPAGQAQTAPQGQAPATTYAAPTADQLYQLVAPIALFPDNLVAQVLAASTYPDQVSAAWTWLQQNSNLKGQQLLEAANQQPWDVSVKGLTQFSDVLQQMATNLSWTSALGDAYFNIPQSVMNAVQVMRQRAYQSGNLKSNQQQNVQVQNQAPGSAPPPPASSGEPQTTVVQPPPQTIIIQPAQPDVVYVPTYNPTVVYGAPVPVYPGYSTGDMIATSLISFGVGVAVGAAVSGGGCCGWGWNSWNTGWHNNTVIYNHNTYISNSNTFVNRNNYYHNANYNNANINNINRNNINANNINRNNINTNNLNRNNLNANNRTNNFSEPHFNQNLNQPQFRNENANNLAQQRPGQGNLGQQRPNEGNLGQQRPNQGNLGQQRGGQQPNFNQNRAGLNQNQQHPNFNQNQQRSNFNENQRQPQRGYGEQGTRGQANSAFGNYGEGGNARVNSARGQQSLEGNRGGGGGFERGGGGGARAAGGGRRR
ncbi:MAG TPA: DUF3300 domain-containing protein [Terriglobales bacterium]